MRTQLAQNQLTPSEDLRAALAEIRHTVMDQVSALYVQGRPAADVAADGANHTAARSSRPKPS
ncbi:hypothetical protein [Fodinicola feengrottensis]|uniref:hypothetical protein n=1 Tax=Fodinicola feengrottensis TaxID=435914 RepID=UPI0013D7F9DF|nr:hypothetical protein [Fodinicola feengrottensis]